MRVTQITTFARGLTLTGATALTALLVAHAAPAAALGLDGVADKVGGAVEGAARGEVGGGVEAGRDGVEASGRGSASASGEAKGGGVSGEGKGGASAEADARGKVEAEAKAADRGTAGLDLSGRGVAVQTGRAAVDAAELAAKAKASAQAAVSAGLQAEADAKAKGAVAASLVGKAVVSAEGRVVGTVRDVVAARIAGAESQVLIEAGRAVELGRVFVAVPQSKVSYRADVDVAVLGMSEVQFLDTIGTALKAQADAKAKSAITVAVTP
ncbi:MAG TPA: PRC-barrel domain-containing protein [Alphaproteobacteria bacterium]|nr:PRC-barrel domain-containing protein [Alphaproteobacteria bacterium]